MSNAIDQARVILSALEEQLKKAHSNAADALAEIFNIKNAPAPWDDEPSISDMELQVAKLAAKTNKINKAKRPYKKKAKYWANPTKKRGKK
jgi:hypothetical protein